MQYSPHAFSDLNADNLRTYGLGITFAQQAEMLMADAVKAGTAKIVTDALRPYEFDREQAVDFGAVEAGSEVGRRQNQSRRRAPCISPRSIRLRRPESPTSRWKFQGKTVPIVGKRESRVAAARRSFPRQGRACDGPCGGHRGPCHLRLPAA